MHLEYLALIHNFEINYVSVAISTFLEAIKSIHRGVIDRQCRK